MNFSQIHQINKHLNTTTVAWSDLTHFLAQYKHYYKLDLSLTQVWSTKQQGFYIEYRLKGGFAGRDIYLNCPDLLHRQRVLIDGEQRLLSVQRFLNDEVPIFSGQCFSDFTDELPSTVTFVFNITSLQHNDDIIKAKQLLNLHR